MSKVVVYLSLRVSTCRLSSKFLYLAHRPLQYLNLLDPVRKSEPKPKPSALLKLGYKNLVLDEYERELKLPHCVLLSGPDSPLASQDR